MTTAPSLCEPHIGYSLMLTIDQGHASSIPLPSSTGQTLGQTQEAGKPQVTDTLSPHHEA